MTDEDVLRAQEARLEALVGSIDEIVFEFDGEGRYLNVWTANEELLLEPRERLLGRNVIDVLGPDAGRPFQVAIRRVLETGTSDAIEHALDLPSGRRWFLSRLSRVPAIAGQPATVAVLSREITERVHDEQALREAERLHRSLIEQIPAITFIELPSDDPRSTHFVYLSPQVESLLGYGAEELMASPDAYFTLIHPDDADRVAEENVRSDLVGRFSARYRVRSRDGRQVWLQSRATLVRDREGRPMFWHGVAMDVTEHQRAQTELVEARERYRSLVEQIPAITFVVVPTGNPDDVRFTFLSPQVEELIGYAAEEVIADPTLFVDRLHPEDRERTLALVQAVGKTGEPFEAEFRVRTRDGGVVWLQSRASPFRDADGVARSWQGVAVDVTEQHLAAEALREAERERQELFARIVAAQEEERAKIAEDLHDDPVQAVTAVGLHIAALASSIQDADARAKLAQLGTSVEQTVARLRNLMFRLWPPSLEDAGLAAAIEEYLWREFGEELGFRVDSTLPEEPPLPSRIVAYRVVQEALQNVRKHARASSVAVSLRPAQDGLAVTVTDDGVGLPWGDQREHEGHLGLRSMRQRVELAGGRFAIAPATPRGTTVSFWLPLT
ncbi:MAG TPA: PAS domain S-box protein [Actinomycetota bacterium]|nr:PAS domain S-box protein [Actinomycetota bacterium]